MLDPDGSRGIKIVGSLRPRAVKRAHAWRLVSVSLLGLALTDFALFSLRFHAGDWVGFFAYLFGAALTLFGLIALLIAFSFRFAWLHNLIKRLADNYFGRRLLSLVGILAVCGFLSLIVWISGWLFGNWP